ncbi:MAG: hypothetical protein V1720_04715 [bacterium]
MAIKYSFMVEKELLRVKATGNDDNLEDVNNYGLAVITAAVSAGTSKVLCDETELIYRLSAFDTFESAKFISENAPMIGKVAIVCNANQIEDASFWETVAVNRGLQVKVCRTVKEAENWLV